MYVYGPENILKHRIQAAAEILRTIPAKYCLISGSFLHKEKYHDIDIFVISRTKKSMPKSTTKVNIHIIDFNDLYSLFYHSITKSCIASNILPTKPLKVTIANYWEVINEAIPTLLNNRDKFHKHIRSLILYTEYFQTGQIPDSFELDQKIHEFKNTKEIIQYINKNIPTIIRKHATKSYRKRFFYTKASIYKEHQEYEAQRFLYQLTHSIARSSDG